MRFHQIMYTRHLWVFVGLVLVAASGCEDPGNRVVVEVNIGFAPAEELDRVEVTIAASATVEGDSICAPYSQMFAVDPDDATDIPLATFPLRIAVKPGSTYNKILYVRVRGWQSGSVRLKTERMVSLNPGGDVRLEMLLPYDCIGIGTGAGQHCVGGFAMRSPYGAIFDDNLHVASDAESCVEE